MKSDKCAMLYDYFSGSLTEDEKTDFLKHLDTCPECQEELNELEKLTSDLPYLSEPVTPPPGMKSRILTNILNEKPESKHKPLEDKQEAEQSVESLTKHKDTVLRPVNETEAVPAKKSRSKTLQYWMVGLAACLFLSLIANIVLFNDQQNASGSLPSQVSKVIYNTELSATKNGTSSMHATASLVEHNNNRSLIIEGSGLKSLSGNSVYQVWLIKNGTPVPAGSFKPSHSGSGAVTYQLNSDQPSQWDAVAISVESSPGHATPQGTIYMQGKF